MHTHRELGGGKLNRSPTVASIATPKLNYREYHVKSLWDDQRTYPPYTSAIQVVRLMQPEADIAQTCTSGTPRGAGNVSSVMKFEVENVRVQGTY